MSRGNIKGIHKVKHSCSGGPHPEQTGPRPGSQPGLLDSGEGESERESRRKREVGVERKEEREKGEMRWPSCSPQ